MAATLLQPPGPRQWDQSQRPQSVQSQPHSDSRERRSKSKRSPNRVKARPANPAIISGILDSFDALGSPTIDEPEEQQIDSPSKPSRAGSVNGTIASAPAPEYARSSSYGFGVEYGATPAREYDDGVVDAAVPPTVYTSRPASGLSHYKAERTPSFTSATGRSPSTQSRRSSFSLRSKEKERPKINKLSSQSWVKQSPAGQEEVQSNQSRSRRSSFRRHSSQDEPRVQATRIELVPQATSPVQISRAEEIIAKVSTPPPSTSKRRLYLTDAGSIDEDSVLETPAPIVEAPELEDFLEDTEPRKESVVPESIPESDEGNATPMDEQVDERSTNMRTSRNATRVSPQKSPIVDSIPTRTSSLRQSSSSPAPGKKKERKSKRRRESGQPTEKKVDSVTEKSSEAIPESSWADLGEDDETVKRIRELREKRKSRLEESRTYSTPDSVPVIQTEPKSSPAMEFPTPREAKDNKRLSRPKMNPVRVSSEISTKAQKILGITNDYNGLPGAMNGGGGTYSNRGNFSLDERRSPVRPVTARSVTPTLSLDYSYADAVDALHGIEREIRSESRHSAEPTVRQSLQVQRPDIPVAETQSANTTPVQQRAKLARSKKTPIHHPDIPLEFEKKRNRRKSTSDAQVARHTTNEVEPPLPRRDSIEVAIGEFLQDDRLSQTVRHPHTGRVISFSEVGDRNGAAVFICVGMGLTRYVTTFYEELASTLRLRLITVDRPGVGGSEPFAATDKSGPLNWPDDVLAICQHLGISKFSMLAHSAGAIYALATALILPHFIKGKVHLLAPWIPPSQLEAAPHYAASTMALPRSQRFLRALPAPFLKAANASFMTATSASLKPAKRRSNPGRPEPRRPEHTSPSSRGGDRAPSSDGRTADFNRRESMMLMDQFMPATDPMETFPIDTKEEEQRINNNRNSLIMSATATPMDPQFEYASTALNAAEHADRVAKRTETERKHEYRSRLTQRTWELATRDSNPATDLLVCLERHREVGFRYTDVHREVVISHGSEDKRVPVANVKWLSEQMNRRAMAALYDDGGDVLGHSTEPPCELRILEGEGHGLMASPMIMGDILTEIAGYWTGQGKGRSTM